MISSSARTAAAIFVASSLGCLLQGCGTPAVTVECSSVVGLKKGCSITFTCSDPPTVKASSECPDGTLTFEKDQKTCQSYVDDKNKADAAAQLQCAMLKPAPASPGSALMEGKTMSSAMEEKASRALRQVRTARSGKHKELPHLSPAV
eukprot:CAMPEP_0194782500 /NCGR_PEP_ID=MMETSP0323_2-20130528/78722_1 /TAXON_ID=2866 ORGANISM="Crypthecodinium cohnii, Strain Seligo" /NCGR_SAMPLE_ID=MMETSP0323_2 /ASSEMBLY_ACC=CAM_ASM_000346 /LENGTH=147 /DNA_ID=CAMNT_0039721317 /DNA_START=75 /DNA_END=518 /DNA_ORIENTATION=+